MNVFETLATTAWREVYVYRKALVCLARFAASSLVEREDRLARHSGEWHGCHCNRMTKMLDKCSVQSRSTGLGYTNIF